MRRTCLPVVLVLLGCTRLNSAYGDGDGAGGSGGGSGPAAETESGSTSGSGSASAGTSVGPGSDATTGMPVGTGTAANGVDTHPPSSEGPDSEVTGDDASTTGRPDARRVVFLWASTSPLDIGTDVPEDACSIEPPAQASQCALDAQPLVTFGMTPLAQLLMMLEGIQPDLEVHGLFGDGTAPLAYAPSDMLKGLLVPLAEGGTGLTDGEPFWSGTADDCMNWQSPNAVGTIGSTTATDPSWSDAGEAPCSDNLRVLCFCLSTPDPFD